MVRSFFLPIYPQHSAQHAVEIRHEYVNPFPRLLFFLIRLVLFIFNTRPYLSSIHPSLGQREKNTRQHTRLRHQPNEVIIHPLAAYYSKPPPKDRNKETLKYSDSKTRERKTGENYFHVLSQFSFSLLFSSRYFAVCFKLISCWLVALFLTHPFRIVSSSLSSNWVLLWGRKYLLSF